MHMCLVEVPLTAAAACLCFCCCAPDAPATTLEYFGTLINQPPRRVMLGCLATSCTNMPPTLRLLVLWQVQYHACCLAKRPAWSSVAPSLVCYMWWRVSACCCKQHTATCVASSLACQTCLAYISGLLGCLRCLPRPASWWLCTYVNL